MGFELELKLTKKVIQIKFVLVAFLLGTFQAVFAATPPSTLSLEMALAEGRAHSPTLQSALAKAREANWKETEGMAGFLPQLSISGSHFFTHTYETAGINFGGSPIVFP